MPDKPTTKRKPGRPRAEINWEQVEQLAGIGCTLEEIAAVIGIADSTLRSYSEYSAHILKGKSAGNASLRRDQRRLAKSNAAMAIFLGKNQLGQSDRHELTGAEGAPVEITVHIIPPKA